MAMMTNSATTEMAPAASGWAIAHFVELHVRIYRINVSRKRTPSHLQPIRRQGRHDLLTAIVHAVIVAPPCFVTLGRVTILTGRVSICLSVDLFDHRKASPGMSAAISVS